MQRPGVIPSRWPQWLLLGTLLALLGWLLAVPIGDSDFWWHLASGRWIWQAGALPQSDPFGVFDDANAIRSATVLQGQWLGQVLFYGLYQLGGAQAIVAARVALLLATLLLLHDRMRQAAIPAAAALASVALAGLCLQGFTGDRPQLLSIFFSALAFWLVDRAARQRTPRLYFLLPLIALAWANAHGGVVLGWITLTLYAVLHWWRHRRQSASDAPQLLLAVALFGGATLLTPNGLDAYAYIINLQGSELQARTSEYISALKIYQLGHVEQQLWVGLVLLLALAGLAERLRSHLGQALLIALLLALSLESFRYFVFLLSIAWPYAVQGLAQLARRWPTRRLVSGRAVSIAMIAGMLALVLAGSGRGPRGGIDAQRYPVALARIAALEHGRGFNFMNWGGYLLWHAPGLTPYIDGRMLDDARLLPYTHMLWASPQGQVWFEQAGFDWVLIPYRDRQGEIYGLNLYLARHPLWRLQARGPQGCLYHRLGS